jgi:hypothetical protein
MAYDSTLKDPMAKAVASADDWDFPTNALPDLSWLGRVHRGTPWQTLYLKAPGTSLSNWILWTGNDQLVTNWNGGTGVTQDAFYTQPTNDWRVASLLVSLLTTNDPRHLLSVNQSSAPPWLGALDGMVVLTNDVPDDVFELLGPVHFTSVVMSSNSPQAATIAVAINAMRSSQPNQHFQDAGDILATPELSVASPWLNTSTAAQQYFGLTDAVYEAIPSQLLPLLRADSVGSVVQEGDTLQIQFRGYEGAAYEVQVSSNLVDWTALSTNYITGGVFTFIEVPSPGAPCRFYRSLLLP